MRRVLARVPLTPLGWVVVVGVVVLGVIAVVAGSGTPAAIAAVGVGVVLLVALGAPRSFRDLPPPGSRFHPPQDEFDE